MKEYLGSVIVSFNIEAHNKEDLKAKIRKQLGGDLVLEEIEIDTVYTDGYDPFDEADRLNDDRKVGV